MSHDPSRHPRSRLSRRAFLVAASGAALSGCDVLDPLARPDSPVRRFLAGANGLTYRAQRWLVGNSTLAREYTDADIRQPQRPNGVTDPQDADYRAFATGNFADWRLSVAGLVERPLSLSLGDLQAMPQRTQITRHDCVEGWSCIAKWTGVPLSAVLDAAGAKPDARYVVIRCMDTIERSLAGEVRYYESIDMVDARHPQTILAHRMNDAALPIANGAPLRLRVERQLGYKMAKYVRAIELTDSLDGYGDGMGGYWEDRGYEWYAGI